MLPFHVFIVHSAIQHSSAPDLIKKNQKQVNSFIRNTLLFVKHIQTVLGVDNYSLFQNNLGKVA